VVVVLVVLSRLSLGVMPSARACVVYVNWSRGGGVVCLCMFFFSVLCCHTPAVGLVAGSWLPPFLIQMLLPLLSLLLQPLRPLAPRRKTGQGRALALHLNDELTELPPVGRKRGKGERRKVRRTGKEERGNQRRKGGDGGARDRRLLGEREVDGGRATKGKE